MAFFPRRKRTDPALAQPDATFRYLTVAEGARLRALVRTAFAERGLEVSLYPDRVEAVGGGQYGLTNLAAHCHASSRRDWPKVVRRHVDVVLRALAAPPAAELDDDTVLGHVFVRVMGLSTIPDLAPFGYHRELGGDLVELLALDSPESVTLLLDTDVERFGVQALRHAGLANLLAEPFGRCEPVPVPGGMGFHLLVGDSVFTASRLLTLDDVLRRTLGDTSAPGGVLACVPTRHQLAFHPIRAPGVLPVIEGMARFAADSYTEGVGPVSPFLYWSVGGRLTQLSFADEQGLRVEIVPELAEALERLGPPDGRD